MRSTDVAGWAVAYGLPISWARSRSMALEDRTLQVARVKRSRYRRTYPSTLKVASYEHVKPYRPPA